MDLLDAVFCRKTVNKFSNEALDEQTLSAVRDYFEALSGMPEGISSDLEIIDNRRASGVRSGLVGFSAPYYALLYSEESVHQWMNIGFKMQRLALYLCTLGLGTHYLIKARVPKKLERKKDLHCCAVLAFGKSKEPYTRRKSDAVRMTAVQMSIYNDMPREWISRLIDAARFAPSYKNNQPWRFLVCSSEFHIFSVRRNAEEMKKTDEMDFGGMLANIMTAAEELWLDVDLIRLDNIRHKNFSPDQYVISAVLKNKDGIL